MKTFLALAAIAICLPLTAMLPSSSSTASLTAPRSEGTWFAGSIASWTVEEDGTVLVQLLVDTKTKWFRTPANQSSSTQFELLTLHAVLALDSRPQTSAQPNVRICGEATTERDGDTVQQAMRLLAIGR
ncbi:MAG: hypothetical protein ACI91B_003343 [Planctomycetota bacterium]|jgi:hypothetical protein